MAGDVGELVLIGDHINSAADQGDLHRCVGAFVAGNHARREDRRVALPQHREAMRIGGDAGHGGARLALAAGDQEEQIVVRN